MVAVNTLITIAHTIYTQVEQAHTNQEQSKLLATRIKRIMEPVADLNILQANALALPLEDLQKCLKEALQLVTQFSDKRWYDMRRLLRAGKYQKDFHSIQTRLERCVIDLNLGINAKSLMNREEDTVAQRADASWLRDNLGDIADSNQATLAAVEKLGTEHTVYYTSLREQISNSHKTLAALLAESVAEIQTDKADYRGLIAQRFNTLQVELAKRLQPIHAEFEQALLAHVPEATQTLLTNVEAGEVHIVDTALEQTDTGAALGRSKAAQAMFTDAKIADDVLVKDSRLTQRSKSSSADTKQHMLSGINAKSIRITGTTMTQNRGLFQNKDNAAAPASPANLKDTYPSEQKHASSVPPLSVGSHHPTMFSQPARAVGITYKAIPAKYKQRYQLGEIALHQSTRTFLDMAYPADDSDPETIATRVDYETQLKNIWLQMRKGKGANGEIHEALKPLHDELQADAVPSDEESEAMQSIAHLNA